MENTPEIPRPPVPTYPWPPDHPDDHVEWSTYLHYVARQCETAYPGSPGRFISAYLFALSDQAALMGATSPEDHESKAEAVRLQDAAWIAALEASAAASDDQWAIEDDPTIDSNDDCTGSLDGHPSQEEGPRRYWFGDIGLDDTYMN